MLGYTGCSDGDGRVSGGGGVRGTFARRGAQRPHQHLAIISQMYVIM